MYHCLGFIDLDICRESFFGQKTRIHKDMFTKVSPSYCKVLMHKIINKSAPNLVKMKGSSSFKTRVKSHASCSWLKTIKVRSHIYRVDIYNAFLSPGRSLLNQKLTRTACVHNQTFCIPKEFPTTALVWIKSPKKPKMTRVMANGNSSIHRIGNWLYVPELSIGGGIEMNDKDEVYLLETGYLINRIEADLENHRKLLKTAQKYWIQTG